MGRIELHLRFEYEEGVFYESKSGNGRKVLEKFKERKPDV